MKLYVVCGLSWTLINIFIKDTDDESENIFIKLSDDNKQGKTANALEATILRILKEPDKL